MWLFDPVKFSMSQQDVLLGEGYMHMQKSRMQFALDNAALLPKLGDLDAVIDYIGDESGILLSQDEMSRILTLYPAQRGKLAVYGWEDTEVREQMLDVIAHFMANTRWPTGGDGIDMDKFLSNLSSAANFMGYETSDEPEVAR